MTCWVEVVRWGLLSSSRSKAIWERIQDNMGCQFVEELRFVSASRPPPRLRQQHQQLLTKFHFRITPLKYLPLFNILRLNTPKPNPNVILCAYRVSILSITKFSLHIHLYMSAWSGQVRIDIQLISWNAFYYSQFRRLTGSNLLTFFLTYLPIYRLTFFLTYHLTYLLIFFLTWHSFWHIFWHVFWHSFWHILWHSFCDISFDILSDISSYKTFRFTGSRVSARRSGAHRSEGFLWSNYHEKTDKIFKELVLPNTKSSENNRNLTCK